MIVNTGSTTGMVALGGAIYGATKAAVNQLTRGLAIEHAKDGIRVNAIAPGDIVTNLGVPETEVDLRPSPERIAAYVSLNPMGREITPEDCANAALFLASDLSPNVNGVVLPVDGGYVAQ